LFGKRTNKASQNLKILANFRAEIESVTVKNNSPVVLFQNSEENFMKKKTLLLLASLIMAVGLLTAACPERKSIADIESNPSKYQNKEVVVAGVVRDSYGINIPLTNIRGGVYKVDDGTGSIWVYTEKSVPSKGTEVGVRGKLQNGLNWNGKNYGIGIMEDDRKFRGK
jgi:hypothetical protein